MSEEHLDLLSFSTRDGVGLRLGDRNPAIRLLAFGWGLWFGGLASEAGEDFGRGGEEEGFGERGAEAAFEAVEAEETGCAGNSTVPRAFDRGAAPDLGADGVIMAVSGCEGGVDAAVVAGLARHERRLSGPYLTRHRSWMLWEFAFGQLASTCRWSGNFASPYCSISRATSVVTAPAARLALDRQRRHAEVRGGCGRGLACFERPSCAILRLASEG